jgi:hypothetical protein
LKLLDGAVVLDIAGIQRGGGLEENAVPDELPLDFHELELLPIQLPDDLRAPLVGEE